MADVIYGVDTGKQVTVTQVRDALVICFAEAHCADVELGGDMAQSMKYCRDLVFNAFEKTGGDFNNPTKESIMAVMDYLANFSKMFRDKEIIQKHYHEMMELVKFISE